MPNKHHECSERTKAKCFCDACYWPRVGGRDKPDMPETKPLPQTVEEFVEAHDAARVEEEAEGHEFDRSSVLYDLVDTALAYRQAAALESIADSLEKLLAREQDKGQGWQ